MKKLFRDTRQLFLTENKFSKYLIFAAVEVLLVVIGILMAVQVNNWNESRKLEILEHMELVQIQKEFHSNLKQLEDKISQRKSIIKSATNLISVIDNNLDISIDSLDFYINKTLFYPTFNPISNDLLASGKINLISNQELKNLLLDWPSYIEQVNEEEKGWVDYRNNYYFPFLTKYYQVRNVLQHDWRKNELLPSGLLEKFESSKFDIGNSKRPSEKETLLRNIDFEDHLSTCISWNAIANLQSNTLKKRINKILSLLKIELEGTEN
jgi:uncharacterized protein DUF6090